MNLLKELLINKIFESLVKRYINLEQKQKDLPLMDLVGLCRNRAEQFVKDLSIYGQIKYFQQDKIDITLVP